MKTENPGWTRAVESTPVAPTHGPLDQPIHTAAHLKEECGEAGRILTWPCWMAFLSSLTLIPLFVAEREQPLELVNKWNVQLQVPADSGCSRGAKSFLDEFHEAERSAQARPAETGASAAAPR